MEMKTLIAQIVDAAVRTAYPGVDAGINYEALLEVPPDSKLGDFAFPCFKLSKTLRMGPPMIAQKLAAAIDRRAAGERISQFLPQSRQFCQGYPAEGDGRARTLGQRQ